MLTNQQIIQLINTGVLQTTSHTVPPKDAYKLLKFKRAVRDAMEKIEDSEKSLPKEAGIEDTEAFDKRLAELRELTDPVDEEVRELEEMQSKLNRLNEMREAFYKEECVLKDVKTMDYESFHTLAIENKEVSITQLIEGKFQTVKYDVFAINEDILEDVLWVAPED